MRDTGLWIALTIFGFYVTLLVIGLTPYGDWLVNWPW